MLVANHGHNAIGQNATEKNNPGGQNATEKNNPGGQNAVVLFCVRKMLIRSNKTHKRYRLLT